MTTGTIAIIRETIKNDVTLDDVQRDNILSFIQSGGGKISSAPIERVYKSRDLQKLLGLSRTRVFQLARQGAFVRVTPPPMSGKRFARATGFTAASVRAFCEGRNRDNGAEVRK